MADHEVSQSYPVAIATGVQIILGALVSAGWATISDTTINVVGSVVALVIAAVAGVVAHSRVTPLSGGWTAQVRDVIQVGLNDAVSQILNTARDSTPAPVRSAEREVSAQPPTERYTPPPASPASENALPAGRWVWTGTTWSWETGSGGQQAPGPAMPRVAQPGPLPQGPPPEPPTRRPRGE